MIISASYKTDIPTFYGEWFMNRLQAGSCKMVNSYGGQIYTISLEHEDVDGFVFWTKNIGPFLKYLPEVREKSYPFIVQHTINNYPQELEFRVINYAHTIEHMKRLAGEYGQDAVVWRYDPIVFSSLTDIEWHKRNFEGLAQSLQGTTYEVVVSFAQIYRKTKRNMDWAAKKFNFSWSEHERICQEHGREIAVELAQTALNHGMQMKICSQKAFLVPGIVEEARCVDADRLAKVAGGSIEIHSKQKGNRKECGCFASKDIGEYDTCPHGCVYCYAVQNRNLALQHFKEHDPKSEFLFSPGDYTTEEHRNFNQSRIIQPPTSRKKPTDVEQPKLF